MVDTQLSKESDLIRNTFILKLVHKKIFNAHEKRLHLSKKCCQNNTPTLKNIHLTQVLFSFS